MTERRSIIGILVLCVFALSAFGVANAAAEEKAYMCEEVKEKAQFTDPHCTSKKPAEEGAGYRHEPIPNGFNASWATSNQKTASGTTASTPSKLRGTISGLEVELECTSVTGTGTLTNSATATSGTGAFSYAGCTVVKPAGKSCVVTEGGFTTATLAATTVGQTAGNVKLSPNSGETIATIPISKCTIEALNNKFPVTGSVTDTATGAALTTTEEGVTKQGTLKLAGAKAGLTGAHTVSTPLGLFAFALT